MALFLWNAVSSLRTHRDTNCMYRQRPSCAGVVKLVNLLKRTRLARVEAPFNGRRRTEDPIATVDRVGGVGQGPAPRLVSAQAVDDRSRFSLCDPHFPGDLGDTEVSVGVLLQDGEQDLFAVAGLSVLECDDAERGEAQHTECCRSSEEGIVLIHCFNSRHEGSNTRNSCR